MKILLGETSVIESETLKGKARGNLRNDHDQNLSICCNN